MLELQAQLNPGHMEWDLELLQCNKNTGLSLSSSSEQAVFVQPHGKLDQGTKLIKN